MSAATLPQEDTIIEEEEKQREVILAVYDSFGKILGYKSDTIWTLTEKESARPHSLEQVLPSNGIARNLVGFLNNDLKFWYDHNKKVLENGKFNIQGKVFVVAEDKRTGEGLMGYSISRRSGGRYLLNIAE